MAGQAALQRKQNRVNRVLTPGAKRGDQLRSLQKICPDSLRPTLDEIHQRHPVEAVEHTTLAEAFMLHPLVRPERRRRVGLDQRPA